MIWDKLSPFYDFFEYIYNGKCYKGIAEKITEYVTEEDIVLECACGTGLLTLPMAQKCKKLIATDYSAGMLRQTKKKVTKYSNTKVQKASILELPFKDNKFDVVVAANVIHLLDEPDKAISELKRVCKPNGKIILPTYINNEKKNSIYAAKLLSVLGVKFKRQFSLASYKEFVSLHNILRVEYSVVEGRMPCAFAIITNC
ncbi:MAG: class I SAM-dependent methyltransferase [Lachnospiraceae bacterium]|nr:class I SAM-dependent methyltransferase [Lachnospiraceae bacterium]